MAKKFMWVCIGILALVVAFELGTMTAEAETKAVPVLATTYAHKAGELYPVIVTSTGDSYILLGPSSGAWASLGNIFGPAEQ
jgi:hypothetical protein